MLGTSAEVVGEALEHDKEKAERIMAQVAFQQYVCKMRTKKEYYGDMLRPKTTLVAALPINYKERNAYVIGHLERLTGISKNAA